MAKEIWKKDNGNGHVRRTKRFVAEPCRLHGAAATKRGVARARIEAAKRIVFIVKRVVLLRSFVLKKGRPAGEE